MLYDKLLQLHLKHAGSPEEFRFPRPSFKACHEWTPQALWYPEAALCTLVHIRCSTQ